MTGRQWADLANAQEGDDLEATLWESLTDWAIELGVVAMPELDVR